MISPGESVKAEIFRQRFYTSIFFNTLLNCFSCIAIFVCNVLKLKIFFLMVERHSPTWQAITGNHLTVLAAELGNWGLPHILQQISGGHFTLPIPQFTGCSPATHSWPATLTTSPRCCKMQMPETITQQQKDFMNI